MFSEILVMIRIKSHAFDLEKVDRDRTPPGNRGKKGRRTWGTGACFSKVLVTFQAQKAALCLPHLHLRLHSRSNNFENDKMKLSVNIHVAKLTGYYGLETVLLFNTFGFYNYLPLGPKSFQAFREMGHRRKGRGEFLGAFLASPSLLRLPHNSSKVLWTFNMCLLAKIHWRCQKGYLKFSILHCS